MKKKWIYYWLKYITRTKLRIYDKNCSYSKRKFLDGNSVNEYIAKQIENKEPLMVCRLGANESFSLRTFYFNHEVNMQKAIDQLCDCAGFFPKEKKYGHQFTQLMCESIKKADLCGVLKCPLDDFFLDNFTPETCFTSMLYSIDPVVYSRPWSLALEGRRVLVIHPFDNSIRTQYKKRDKLFEDKRVLPDFELITLRAIQTSAGQKDERFQTWFEALGYMEEQIKEIEFDVALLGCGAYGLPLAAYIKSLGKQAIHIGGGLQILFGIKGKRWDNNEKINRYYNEYWVYPDEAEKPQNAVIVEDGCYWG